MRRLLPIALTLALAAMAAVALAQVGGSPAARAAVIAGSGSFEITNSGEGSPIFAAAGIAPGGSTSGAVTIEDAGSAAIALELHRGELTDTPGTGGGVLSGRLGLTVVDVTDPAAPRTVYSGPLATMPDTSVGRLAGGEARIFRFTATLPEGGSASFQNAVQGASTTVAYSWTAEEASGEGGGGTPPGAGGNPQPSEGGVGASRGNQVLDLTVPKVRRGIRGGRLVAWTTCQVACTLSVRGHIRATVAGVHRGARFRFARSGVLAPGPQRLRIPIPRRLRHWLAVTPGKARVRARLRFIAVGTNGERDVVPKALNLRARRRR